MYTENIDKKIKMIEEFYLYIGDTRGELTAFIVLTICTVVAFNIIVASIIFTNGYMLIAYLALGMWWLYNVYQEFLKNRK